MVSNYTGIRKEYIQSPICLHGMLADLLDGLFICSVKLSCVDFDIGI